MSAKWTIVGQIGNVIKKENCYLVNIADNRYAQCQKQDGEEGRWEKKTTIWFNCISDFVPKVGTGDTVIAEGEYLKSNNPKYPYVMKIDHIGVITKSEK